MSLSQNEDEYAFDEDELLDEIEVHVPANFFRGYQHRRTRQTVALLDYINHLKDGQPSTPVFSSISGNNSRQEALAALKRAIPDRCFTEVGIRGGKRVVSAGRDRIDVLLAAQAYLAELSPQEEPHEFDGSGTPEAQKLPDLDHPVHDLHSITAAPPINTPIDRLVFNAKEAQIYARRQDEQVQQLSRDKAGLEQTIMEQRRKLARQRQDVEDAGVLRSMMTVAVGREVVENTLGLVREGRKVEDVVAEVLKKAFRP